MSTVTPNADDTFVIKRGALRTHRFLLDEGGWWALREIEQALELSDQSGLGKQLRALLHHKCIVRKGTGTPGDPYTYGVTPPCTDPIRFFTQQKRTT
jgi:hypothetical protein